MFLDAQPVIAPAEPRITKKLIVRVKADHFKSWNDMAHALGYDSRTSLFNAQQEPVNEKFKVRFQNLLRTLRKGAQDLPIVYSAQPLPATVELQARIRSCRRCHQKYIPSTPWQKHKCGDRS